MLQSAHPSLPPSTAESRDTSPEQDNDTVVSIKSPLLGEFFHTVRQKTMSTVFDEVEAAGPGPCML